ncbi:MAG: DUF4178 domain-containing protein [Candidatus Riflebacteria bacterium]|nr:DUF4178 domain-containing protein [Candidatus Riflebacteria bacterium]
MCATKAPPVQVKSVKCTKCAAPLEIRAPQSIQTVACGSCGAVLDAKHPDLTILSQYASRIKYKPLIPLGTKGRLKGEQFMCIGFLRRRTTVEGVNYDWSEYLLYNPYKGFRWLTEYQGHWTSVKAAHVTPKLVPSSLSGGAGAPQGDYEVLGNVYKHFQSVVAQVIFVVGEFYWEVKVGERAECSDYVSPPNILSRESSENEITWSIGDYTTGKDVWEAFSLPGEPPAVTGVAAAQPSPHAETLATMGRDFWTFAAILVVLQILFAFTSADKKVFSQGLHFSKSSKAAPVASMPSTDGTTATTEVDTRSKVSDYFDIDGRTCNVVIKTAAAIDNHWMFNQYALINEKTQTAYNCERELEYYHGRDSDGPWSEGSKTDEVTIPGVPAGRYFVYVYPDSDQDEVDFSLVVYRDVLQWWPLFLGLFFLAIPPLWVKYRQWSFEVERWKESDHPLITSGEGSSDDD